MPPVAVRPGKAGMGSVALDGRHRQAGYRGDDTHVLPGAVPFSPVDTDLERQGRYYVSAVPTGHQHTVTAVPTSGTWRIPSVYTRRSFHPANSERERVERGIRRARFRLDESVQLIGQREQSHATHIPHSVRRYLTLPTHLYRSLYLLEITGRSVAPLGVADGLCSS